MGDGGSLQRVTSDPETCAGKPVLRRFRISADPVLSLLARMGDLG